MKKSVSFLTGFLSTLSGFDGAIVARRVAVRKQTKLTSQKVGRVFGQVDTTNGLLSQRNSAATDAT